MKNIKRNFWRVSTTLIFAVIAGAGMGCAEKKARIWIEPPPGVQTSEKNPQKLYYQVEDIQTGKKENLIIPLNNLPENLVVQDNKKPHDVELEFSKATDADRQISNGKLPSPKSSDKPTVSYLRGLAEVEDLYQKQKFSEALVRLAPLVEQYPKQSRLYVMQGTLFRKIGEKKLALQAYQKAQQLDPNNPSLEEAVLKSQDELGGSL